ncbi:MAG TPA: transcriptional regulator NrdR [candidate division Zixibacteria bacterium]
MRCPFCGQDKDRVVDSRTSQDGKSIRRRRECEMCRKRFTTYEYVEDVSLTIIKNDGRREPFDRQKLQRGIELACKKRPISSEQITAMVDEIQEKLQNLSKPEITSQEVGEEVIRRLKDLDEVAYVRFASVYHKFKDVSAFMDELKGLLK